jgi:hypothetical protein
MFGEHDVGGERDVEPPTFLFWERSQNSAQVIRVQPIQRKTRHARGVSVVRIWKVPRDVPPQKRHRARVVRQQNILGTEFRGAHPEQTRARAELDDALASHALPPVALQQLRETKRALPHDSAAAVVQGLILLHH